MSYAAAAALQEAVFQCLADDAGLADLVGGAIYDAPPPGRLPPLHVSLGPEEARDRSDGTGAGAEHRFTVSVISEASGFHLAKSAAGAVCDALLGAALPLARGRLAGLFFDRARAFRIDGGARRRIDLRFRARIDTTETQ